MTKYTKKTPQFDNRNRKVVIDAIAYEDSPVREYVCDSCNFIVHTRKTEGEVTCLRCNSLLELDKTQELSIIEDPNEEIQPAISTIPTPGYGDVAIKKQPNYKGSFAELAKRVRFTSYEEKDGAGRTIT